MGALPFFIVTLGHPAWEEALACARRLPADALPELRLDLFPDEDPESLVQALRRRCVVSCRRAEDGGRWTGDEASRLRRLEAALPGRPAWMDLEWELPLEGPFAAARSHVRFLRSVHAGPGVFDLEARLEDLPPGEAWKWCGVAGDLSDNARLRAPLARARDRRVPLSAFLRGPKGIPGRCLQAAWGGAFTYAAPDDAPPAADGQLPLSALLAWRAARLHTGHGLCGVLGSPVLHSLGPDFHNARFQRAFKDLLYLPLDCAGAPEAAGALEALDILGASLTSPLKETLPALLGLQGPLNTLWRRAPGAPWQGTNTDALALEKALQGRPGPVLLLGDGATARTSAAALARLGLPFLQTSRRAPLDPQALRDLAPRGLVQATRLGMDPADPLPFPELLELARPGLAWALEWVYKEDTALARWAREAGLDLVEGRTLFESQAEAQSAVFIRECGGEY